MSPALHISIPETSIAGPPAQKPYTQYHIVLQLPLRRQEARKRYNDFTKLDQDLRSEAGSSPPAPLPAKGWFQRTVNNESLTEQRRLDLERYLRAIIDTDDARWRSTRTWRVFLDLQADNDASSRSINSHPRPQTLDASEWLELHRKLKSRIQEARQQIKQRDTAVTAQQQHHIAAEAKATLVRAATMIEELDTGLGMLDNKESGRTTNQLGTGEWRRRKDLVAAARKEVQALDGVLRTAARPTEATVEPAVQERTSLMANRSKAGGRVLGPAKETERTRELDNTGVVQLQQQIMQEQDEDVMLLGKTITKLKDMGVMMNEELTIQNEMLRVVDEDIDRVQAKVDVGRKRIKKIK